MHLLYYIILYYNIIIYNVYYNILGFPGGSAGKESVCNVDSIPGLGRFPGEENGYPLQYSCLENSIDRGAWRTAVHGITKNQTRMSD